MSDSLPMKRPGGITALAILNIVFALLGMLGGIALNAMNKDADQMTMQADLMDDQADRIARDPSMEGNPDLNRAMVRGMAQQMRMHSAGAFKAMWWSGMVGGILLLVSGFGLLGQRRVAGRYGAVAASAALFVCCGVAVMKLSFMFWGFPMLGAAYAMVLVCLIQFAYRPALQR